MASEACNSAALYRLLAWLSPAYPVGAFSYSTGIEWAVEARDITDAVSLQSWICTLLDDGGGFTDAVLFVHAYRTVAADEGTRLHDIVELAASLSPSRERHLETTAQGNAFIEATRKAWPCSGINMLQRVWTGPVAYPVAVAVAAAGHAIPLEPALSCFLQALAANWISAGVRLVPLGQSDGLRIAAAVEPNVVAVAHRALQAGLDDFGSSAYRADLASLHHETQYTRLFRS